MHKCTVAGIEVTRCLARSFPHEHLVGEVPTSSYHSFTSCMWHGLESCTETPGKVVVHWLSSYPNHPIWSAFASRPHHMGQMTTWPIAATYGSLSLSVAHALAPQGAASDSRRRIGLGWPSYCHRTRQNQGCTYTTVMWIRFETYSYSGGDPTCSTG